MNALDFTDLVIIFNVHSAMHDEKSPMKLTDASYSGLDSSDACRVFEACLAAFGCNLYETENDTAAKVTKVTQHGFAASENI